MKQATKKNLENIQDCTTRNVEHGAILAEMCLILPIIFFITGALLSIGQAISQISWLAQTAYQSVLVGSEHADAFEARATMLDRATSLIATSQDISRTAKLLSWHVVDAQQDAVNGMVSVEFRADFDLLIGGTVRSPISVKVTGPILVNLNPDTSDLGVPQNPAGVQYDCNGAICVSGSCPVSCLTCQTGGSCA